MILRVSPSNTSHETTLEWLNGRTIILTPCPTKTNKKVGVNVVVIVGAGTGVGVGAGAGTGGGGCYSESSTRPHPSGFREIRIGSDDNATIHIVGV